MLLFYLFQGKDYFSNITLCSDVEFEDCNLIKYNPINPNIKGREILKNFGKKNVILNFKNEFIKTSTILKITRDIPI